MTEIIKQPRELIVSGNRDNLFQLIEKFVTYRSINEKTVKLYRNMLGKFASWISETKRSFYSLSPADLNEFRKYLIEKSDTKSLRTSSLLITVVKSFFKWTKKQNLYPDIASDLERPRIKKEFKHKGMTPEQYFKLIFNNYIEVI